MAVAPSELIEQTLRVLRPDPPVELRAIYNTGKVKVQRFGDHADAVRWAQMADATARSIYVVMNPFDPDSIIGAAVDDAAVTHREWLLIDVDPVRPKDSNSTNNELRESARVATAVEDGLTSEGWPLPVRAISGNGAHLLYRVELPNDPPALNLVQRALKVLDRDFSDAAAKIDVAVANAARITKLYGTVARKGEETVGRLHRRSRLTRIPDALQAVASALLHALADRWQEPRQPPIEPPSQRQDGYNVGEVLARLVVRRSFQKNGITYYVIACPWASEHSTEREDAATVFTLGQDGRLGFGCLHDHCQHRTWVDLRDRIGVDTMSWQERKARGSKGQQRDVHQRDGGGNATSPSLGQPGGPAATARGANRVTVCDLADREGVLTEMDFYARFGRMPDSISTGMRHLDSILLGGFRPGMFYALGGESGRGKSSLLMQWALWVASAIEEDGKIVGIVTPEMSANSLSVRAYAYLTGLSLSNYRYDPENARITWESYRPPQNIRASFDPTDIESFIAEEKPALFVVDYAQQAVDYNDKQRYTALAQLGKRCIEIAKSTKIPVVMGSQVNVTADREFGMRETKILEHQADVVMYIDVEYEKALLGPDGHPAIKPGAALRIHKHRHGPTGRVPITWNPSIYRFDEEGGPKKWPG